MRSHLYSFSFRLHDWSRTHARQAELQKYLEEVVDEFGLRPHLSSASRSSRGVGRRTPRVTLHDRRRDDRRVPRAGQRPSDSSTCRATPTGPGSRVRGAGVPHRRWEHHHELRGQARGGRGNRLGATQVVPAIADRERFYVPARAGLGAPQGRARLHARRSARRSTSRCAPARALAPRYCDEREPAGAGPPRPGTQTNAAQRESCLRLHRARLRRPPGAPRGRDAELSVPGKRVILASTFYPALKKRRTSS